MEKVQTPSCFLLGIQPHKKSALNQQQEGFQLDLRKIVRAEARLQIGSRNSFCV